MNMNMNSSAFFTNNESILCISAMRSKEEHVDTCHNYLAFCDAESQVNRYSRKDIVNWCFEVADALDLSLETVHVALSYFDRYLSSAKTESSQEALNSLPLFELAASVSLYLATRFYEPYKSGESLDVFIQMSPRDYNQMDVISMEQDILVALDRCMDIPTPMDFVRELLQLLPDEYHSQLLQCCEKYLHKATCDLYYSFYHPSVVGAGMLASSLVETNVLSVSERNRFWSQLTHAVDLIGAMEVQKKLLKMTRPMKFFTQMLVSSSGENPVLVTQSARGA
jgi:hypothetical protein